MATPTLLLILSACFGTSPDDMTDEELFEACARGSAVHCRAEAERILEKGGDEWQQKVLAAQTYSRACESWKDPVSCAQAALNYSQSPKERHHDHATKALAMGCSLGDAAQCDGDVADTVRARRAARGF